jgi:hypothetical protein
MRINHTTHTKQIIKVNLKCTESVSESLTATQINFKIGLKLT